MSGILENFGKCRVECDMCGEAVTHKEEMTEEEFNKACERFVKEHKCKNKI